MQKLKKSTVRAEILTKIGEEAFPDVTETCETCHGKGYVTETVHGVRHSCDDCRGMGYVVRTMTAREEHFWIIHLLTDIQTRYQLR